MVVFGSAPRRQAEGREADDRSGHCESSGIVLWCQKLTSTSSRLSKYEDMVSVLLSRLRQAHRVDGSGGDEGRDCYFTDEHGTDAFELKSFTGRMAKARRRQVKQSLGEGDEEEPADLDADRADRPDPGRADLVRLPGRRVWHAQLDWLGKNWLKEQLARFPDIVRYFSGAADEVVRILAEISREDALPGDAAGLAQRFAGQASRLNEIDPYYWFEFGIAGEMVTVTAHPNYPDAPRDRPITMTATLQFDDSPGQQEARAAFEDFMKFGTPVTIPPASITRLAVDAPGGLGGEFEGGTLILDGTFPPGVRAGGRGPAPRPGATARPRR